MTDFLECMVIFAKFWC